MAELIQNAIQGQPTPAEATPTEIRAANVEFIREKLLAAMSAATAAAMGMAEILRHDLDRAAHQVETWQPGEMEPLGEEVIEPLADALHLCIEAQGLIDPHHRMHAAIERYQGGED